MLGIEYNAGQLNNFENGLNGLKNGLIGRLYEAVESAALDIQTTAKIPGYVPYKTGNLKRSITHKTVAGQNEVVGYVGTNVIYARIQEFGGKAGRKRAATIQGKFYLSRAVDENQEKTRQKFAKLLALKGLK